MADEQDFDYFGAFDEDYDEELPCYCCNCCGWVGAKKPVWNQCPNCNAIVEEEFL